jgi:hypothetical protein
MNRPQTRLNLLLKPTRSGLRPPRGLVQMLGCRNQLLLADTCPCNHFLAAFSSGFRIPK